MPNYLIAIIGLIIALILWVWIQDLWRKAFAEEIDDADVLAGRSRCGGCGCVGYCDKNKTLIKKHKL